jgi:hypothetical protein
MSLSEQLRQKLERTNAELMMRIQELETTQASAEQDAYDAMQNHAKAMEIARQLEEENGHLQSRVSSLESDNASMQRSEQLRRELKRTNAELLMRIQASETTQASAEQDAYDALQNHAKAMEIAQQLEEENTDLKSRVSTLKAQNVGFEEANAHLEARIEAVVHQASLEHDSYVKMRYMCGQLQKDNTNFKRIVMSLEGSLERGIEHDAYNQMRHICDQLQKENTHLKCKVRSGSVERSLERDDSRKSISSPEQRRSGSVERSFERDDDATQSPADSSNASSRKSISSPECTPEKRRSEDASISPPEDRRRQVEQIRAELAIRRQALARKVSPAREEAEGFQQCTQEAIQDAQQAEDSSTEDTETNRSIDTDEHPSSARRASPDEEAKRFHHDVVMLHNEVVMPEAELTEDPSEGSLHSFFRFLLPA